MILAAELVKKALNFTACLQALLFEQDFDELFFYHTISHDAHLSQQTLKCFRSSHKALYLNSRAFDHLWCWFGGIPSCWRDDNK